MDAPTPNTSPHRWIQGESPRVRPVFKVSTVRAPQRTRGYGFRARRVVCYQVGSKRGSEPPKHGF